MSEHPVSVDLIADVFVKAKKVLVPQIRNRHNLDPVN
jgi:hypothetical protein